MCPTVLRTENQEFNEMEEFSSLLLLCARDGTQALDRPGRWPCLLRSELPGVMFVFRVTTLVVFLGLENFFS